MSKTTEQPHVKSDSHIYRKCPAVFLFLMAIFAFIIVIIFVLLTTSTATQAVKNSWIEFLMLIELVVLVCLIEAYVSSITLSDKSVIIENWILFKQKIDIPYNKINSVKTYSIFWLWGIEIYTGNDIVTKYSYLDKYTEVAEILNSKIKS